MNQLSPLRRLEEIVKRILKKIIPNYFIIPGAVYGRIVKINLSSGKVNINFKRYSFDIQVLNKNLSINDNFKIIKDVPADSKIFGSSGGGVFNVPDIGTIVRLNFMYNDLSYPYIEAFTNENKTIPEARQKEYRVDNGNGIIFVIVDNKIKIKTNNYNIDLQSWINLFLNHNHLGNSGSPTSSPAGSPTPTIPADFKTGDL